MQTDIVVELLAKLPFEAATIVKDGLPYVSITSYNENSIDIDYRFLRHQIGVNGAILIHNHPRDTITGKIYPKLSRSDKEVAKDLGLAEIWAVEQTTMRVDKCKLI